MGGAGKRGEKAGPSPHGQDRVCDLHCETELVLAVEVSHGLDSLGNGTSTADQHTVNVEGVGKAVGDRGMLRWRGRCQSAGRGALEGRAGRCGHGGLGRAVHGEGIELLASSGDLLDEATRGRGTLGAALAGGGEGCHDEW